VGAKKFIEGSKFKRLSFPDPFGYGAEYCPIFPPRHHAMKAIMSNLPESISKVYVYGSSIRSGSAVNSDLDVFLVGAVTNAQLAQIIRAIPDNERVDFLVEKEDEFQSNVERGDNSFYQKVYEGGYKIYDRAG